MKEHDDAELLRRVQALMSGIDAHVPEPPRRKWIQAVRPNRPRSRLDATALIASAVVVALVGVVIVLSPDRRPSAGVDTPPVASPTHDIPPERLVRVDTVSLDADKLTVLLEFVGGPPYSPANPCSTDYAATAEVVGDRLDVAVFELERPTRPPLRPTGPPLRPTGPPLPLEGCPGVGFRRTLELTLAVPFEGYRVHDLGGDVHFVARPDGLVELDIPPGWQLESEASVSGSPTGRWRRSYTRDGTLAGAGPGRFDLYQAFDGPAGVEGALEQPPVTVNGTRAALYLWPEAGEIVLVWSLKDDGLALVANEADFSVDELIALAETARPPGSPTTGATPEPTTTPSDPAQASLMPGPSPLTLIEVDARPLVGPIKATVRSSAVWTGSEVIYWGGWYMAPDYRRGSMWSDHGAAYNPSADSWRTLRSAPLSARERHFAGWTGEEMLIWGGSGDQGFTADGAAYDPLSDSWRLLPPAPPAWVADLREMEAQGGAEGPATVWTGQHWVIGFKAIGDDESDPIRVAAYEPASDAWHQLPTVRGPRGGGLELVWTGTELVLISLEEAWRMELHGSSWQPISRAPYGLPLSSPVWLGDRLLAIVSKWGPNATPWSFLATWDPISDTWESLVQPPWSAHGQILMDGDIAVVLGSGLAYDLSTNAWLELPLEVTRNDAVLAWTGNELVVWGGWECDMCPSGVFQEGLVLTPER